MTHNHPDDEKDKANIEAVSNQPREEDGKIRVYVSKKYDTPTFNRLVSDSRTCITEDDRISKTVVVDGCECETDVVEIGRIQAEVMDDKFRPLVDGMQISPKDRGWYGTLGGHLKRHYVKLPRKGETDVTRWPLWAKNTLRRAGLLKTVKFGVTNRHVTRKRYGRDTPEQIYTQPQGNGSAYRYVEASTKPYHVDSALLEPLHRVNTSGYNAVRPRSEGLGVKKTGARTGITTGEVIDAHVDARVDMGNGVHEFQDVAFASDMSDAGDSGSFIVHKDELVGLLFAGSSKVTVFFPIQRVLEHHGVTI